PVAPPAGPAPTAFRFDTVVSPTPRPPARGSAWRRIAVAFALGAILLSLPVGGFLFFRFGGGPGGGPSGGVHPLPGPRRNLTRTEEPVFRLPPPRGLWRGDGPPAGPSGSARPAARRPGRLAGRRRARLRPPPAARPGTGE